MLSALNKDEGEDKTVNRPRIHLGLILKAV